MYILRELTKHTLAYTILVILLGVAFYCYVYWADTTQERQLITLAVTVGYFAWGIITHVTAEHITRQVIQEYAGIAVLGGLILLLLTF